jgi:hypothetical protein
VPFRSRPGQPRDLFAQIEDEMRDRVREAVDHVSLNVMVERRRAAGLPQPAVDSPEDRDEFEAGVRAFLERLAADLTGPVTAGERRTMEAAAGRGVSDPLRRLLDTQVALARALPDYWQRFEDVRYAYTAERVASGGESRGLLRRLFGH